MSEICDVVQKVIFTKMNEIDQMKLMKKFHF